MQVNDLKNSSCAFKGYKPDPRNAGKYLLKKKEFQLIDTLSFITALTSMTGFTVGGSGLLSDLALPKDKKHNEPIQNQGGAKTIVPSTPFSKIGLIFAKIGIAFSGIAGVFNGISMGLPLMAAGEGLNVISSPIIETPLGTGLFGIALAGVFSGRALENDPALKMDKVKLAQQKGLLNKAAYILDNMKNCIKEVFNTSKIFVKNTFGILYPKSRQESISFFRDSVFTIKPKKLIIQEFINKEGKVIIKTGFKNNPYLMHAASLVLALGGITLALCSVIHNKIGQKIGLTTYETGGSLDNLSLSRWGWEKAAMANTPSAKLAGNLLGLSGLGILAGQPGVDEKWGRGTQWIGTALLFAVFAVERKGAAFKRIASKSELTSLIRQWEVDLTKLHSPKQLKGKLNGIINAVKDDRLPEDIHTRTIIETANRVLSKDGTYIKDSKELAAKIEEEIIQVHPELKDKLSQVFKHEGRDGILEDLSATLSSESERIFQKE